MRRFRSGMDGSKKPSMPSGKPRSDDNNRSVFLADDAIARFGVGKNMVSSIRHWATASGVIRDVSRCIVTTALGQRLFGSGGLDPYMENPATAWLVHWHLCGRPDKTTWFWAFNYFPAPSFERDMLVKSLEKLAKDREWRRASTATIRNDVTCASCAPMCRSDLQGRQVTRIAWSPHLQSSG